jgi:type II secretion system protein I
MPSPPPGLSLPGRALAQRGFTLLEVLIALAIIGATILSLQMICSRNIERADYANSKRMARMLARQKIEEIVLGLESDSSGEFEEYPGFSWKSEEISAPVENTEESVVQLTLTVRYPGMGGALAAAGEEGGRGERGRGRAAEEGEGTYEEYSITTLLEPAQE